MPSTSDSKQPVQLPLVRGAPDVKLSFLRGLQLALVILPRILVDATFNVLRHFVFTRSSSPLVQEVGRSAVGDIIQRSIRNYFAWATFAQIRVVLNRNISHKLSLFADMKSQGWVEYVHINGTKGRWIAPPGTNREDDKLVLLWVHGGAFVWVILEAG
ncbi:hypothetical protein P7C70_g4539, partial [Phenoliferia sp. Uapishka_3]